MRNSLTEIIGPHDTYGALRGLADRLGINVRSRPLPDELCGYYVRRLNLIVIDRTMTYREKRCTLVHELCHWRWSDEFKGLSVDDKLERRTKRETAAILVNESEYRQAEGEYDGNDRLIAVELDVTRQIIDDYRELVLPGLLHC